MKKYLLIGESLEEFRKSTLSTRHEFFKRLTNQCEKYFIEEIPESHPTKSTTYMGMAMVNLSLAYLLTKQKNYLEEAKRWMNGVCNYPKWGNAHLVDVDLSASWILIGLSLSYDWLFEELDEETKRKVCEKLILQAQKMYKYKKQTFGKGWSTQYWQNHNWINHTSLFAAGVSLLNNKNYLEGKIWIDDANENFKNVFDGLADDGSDYEGAVYWRYGVFWLSIYARMLKDFGGKNYFMTNNFLKNTFYFRLYQSNGDLSKQVAFGDCHDRYSSHSPAMYYLLADETDNGHAQYLGDLIRKKFLFSEALNSKIKPGILPEAAFEFIFFNPNQKTSHVESLPLYRNFSDLGLLYCRSSWNADATIYTTKCSAPGGNKQWKKLHQLKKSENIDAFGLSHHHPDNNSFVFISNGEYLAVDEGYNRKSTADVHNMVTVDGIGYEDEGQKNIYNSYTEEMVGYQKKVLDEENYILTIGETSATYSKKLEMTRVERQSLFRKGDYPFVIIVDHLVSRNEHNYTWQIQGDIFPEKISYSDYSLSANFRKNNTRFTVLQKTKFEIGYQLKSKVVKEIMTTQEPDNFREAILQQVKISSKYPSKEAVFVTVLFAEGLEHTPKICDFDFEITNEKCRVTIKGYGEKTGEYFFDIKER